MTNRILSITAAAAIAIASLGATAPVQAAPLGAATQALSGQADNLVIPVGHNGKGKHWKFKKFVKLHKNYYPRHYPYWCWEKVLIPTKYGYVEKNVFVCH
jgi:hypothetical protein